MSDKVATLIGRIINLIVMSLTLGLVSLKLLGVVELTWLTALSPILVMGGVTILCWLGASVLYALTDVIEDRRS